MNGMTKGRWHCVNEDGSSSNTSSMVYKRNYGRIVMRKEELIAGGYEKGLL